jgi:membrane fusion protein (multidrug efflux system)
VICLPKKSEKQQNLSGPATFKKNVSVRHKFFPWLIHCVKSNLYGRRCGWHCSGFGRCVDVLKPQGREHGLQVSSAAVSPQGASRGAGRNGASSESPLVKVAGVEVARLTDETQAVGSLRSRRSVVLRPQVSGRVSRLDFTDGQRVRKGQVLVQFDDQLQQAQLQQSQAEMSIAIANQKRNQDLVAQNFVSQRSLDASAANLQVAQAKLALAKATAARLKIVAPFHGIAGIRQVSAGDYLKNGADIVNIEDVETIFVDFRLPERFQARLKRGQTAMLDIDALPG